MYLLNKCAIVEGFTQPQSHAICITHLQMIALAIFHVSRPFKAKKLKDCDKYAQLLHYDNGEAIMIGEATPTYISDKNENKFYLSVEGDCYLENFLIHKITGQKELKSTYTTTYCNNAIKLLSTAIHFHDSILNTSQSKWRKESYYYAGDKLLYIFDRNGIYDIDRKKIFNFDNFLISKSIPKRLKE